MGCAALCIPRPPDQDTMKRKTTTQTAATTVTATAILMLRQITRTAAAATQQHQTPRGFFFIFKRTHLQPPAVRCRRACRRPMPSCGAASSRCIPRIAKESAICQCKIIIPQGQFSILSALSITNDEQKVWDLCWNLPQGPSRPQQAPRRTP